MESTQVNPSHNTDAILIGRGEFFFSEGATSLAAALLLGYRSLGNIKATTPTIEKTEVVHKGSYRGGMFKDRIFNTEQAINYEITAEEWDKETLRYLFRGDAGAGHTQSIQTAAIVDTFVFTAPIPSVIGKWYQITTGGERLTNLTTVNLLTTGTGTSAAGANSGDVFTAVAHGLLNGATIILRGGTVPAGATANTLYYIVNKSNDTFQISLTSGGSAVVLTGDGTTNFYPALIEGTDFFVDCLLGQIRLATSHTTTITPTITAPAIDTTDDEFLNSIIPLGETRYTGYGRLVIYDDNVDDRIVAMDHRDFKCEVIADTAGAIDGQNISELKFKINITSEEPGEIFSRN